jgi:hypothetical protein
MSYRDVPNWPPAWINVNLQGDKTIRGEIGILTHVIADIMNPRYRIHLIVEHQEGRYMGSLLFDDEPFARQIHEILSANRGSPIDRIGDLEVGHLL